MPKIRPAPPQARRAFRRTLSSQQQRKHFDELAERIDQRSQDLDWYHAVGRESLALRPSGTARYHGSAWFVRLSQALGPGQWLFHKAVRFVELYPAKKAVQELKRRGVEWTRLKLSFSIRDPKKRLALLTRAVKEKWSIGRFHFEAMRRHPTGRRGVGGQPRRSLKGLGPEAALEELLGASRAWLHVHGEVWERQDADFRTQLNQLVHTTDDARRVLEEVQAACMRLGR